ncbi:protein kintoun-like [Acanthaster planci]|uniref:Protein kintoun n=1 Tax=Acanthaster planci TaxID=133434 RepID=A0A8B7YBK3_ACAPL|nr:protein kintoun-like [Acanthaster planci]
MASSEDLDVTPEELERISKALKDEKFRQLFVEYAQEISDPENRKKYEEEIAQLEKNRGTDVVFVHPEPGYVIKTNVNGEQKAFINVCKSDKIAKPTAANARRADGCLGTQWSVPHSLAPGREDLDKSGQKCVVYDCVFHPDCFQAAEKEKRLVNVMDDTALSSIESNFNIKLDRQNVTKMKNLKFKGQPRPTVLRTKSKSGPSGETDALKDFNIEYPYKDANKKNAKGGSNLPAKSASKISGTRNTSSDNLSDPIEPKYSIIHRGHFDMQHFTNAPDSMPTTRPHELIVKIQLPLLKSIATVQLDVFEKRIALECQKPASYKLNLVLPYPVNQEKGAAKFDKSKSCLTITLPVLPPEIPELPSFAPEPQGVSLVEEIPQINETEKEPGEYSIAVENRDKGAHKDASPNEESACDQLDKSRTFTSSDATDNADKAPPENQEEQGQLPSQEEVALEQDDREVAEEDSTPEEKASQDASSEMERDEEHCPDYIFRQDDATVSFILDVTGTDPDSLQKQISGDKTTLSLKFRSETLINGETASVPYSFCVVFEPPCQIGDMQLDVQATETVILLHKTSTCQGEWSHFKAGVSQNSLEDKLFLTEDNVRHHLKEMTKKRRGKRPASAHKIGMDCGVIEASDNKLVIELEAKVNGDALSEDKMSDVALGTVTDTVIDAMIGELSSTAAALKLDLKQADSSPGSDNSNPSTPCSPSGLRSALRDGNHSHRTQRSVSFSEDVVVETMVRGSPSKARGKNKRHQPPRPRRFITKLRDTSQNQGGTCSDSEIQYWRGARGREEKDEDEDQDEEFQEEVVFPEWAGLERQTSSDSSGGECTSPAPDSKKKKKPKANKRQRKKMNAAKRAMALDEDDGRMKESWFEPRHPLRSASSEGSLPTSQNLAVNGYKDKFGGMDATHNQGQKQGPAREPVNKRVQTETDSKMQEEKSQANTKNDAEVPLELQDHRTQSAVTFGNQVMFELDD